MPHEEIVLYQPSQHLCDIVRNMGFSGIIYPSAMGPGHNVVIFNPQASEILDYKYVRVNDINYKYEELRGKELPYPETPYDHLLPDGME